MSIEIVSDELCCGCGLCENICPKKCINLEYNDEGFLHPSVNSKICIECGLCEKYCSVLKNTAREGYKDTYLGYNPNVEVREKSSSGGLFRALAMEILNYGGVVYGAAIKDDVSVGHVRVDNHDKLEVLMASKYVQSTMGNSYKNISADLKNGRLVLFTGTPCQVTAVYNYIRSRGLDEKLYLMDFVCHGVPSPGVLKSYVKYKQSQNGKLKSITFRDKKHGWHDYHMKFEYANGMVKYVSHETDPYMIGFLSDKNMRNSCYDCKSKGDNYSSDITVGDAWKIEKESIGWNDDKGVSMYIVRTDKGRELIDKIHRNGFNYVSADYNKWKGFNPSLTYSAVKPESRTDYFKRFANEDNKTFWYKNSKIPVKRSIRYFVKKVLKACKIDVLARKLQ